MNKLTERFLKYIKIDTESDPKSETTPSTQKQFDLAHVLVDELRAMGLEADLDERCYIMATLPANIDADIPVIGFVAHMDTSPDMVARGVNPKIIANYNGGDIVLNESKGIVLSPVDFPELLDYKGQDLITTDGTTLLGADDKAGVSEIMTAIEYLVEHPEIKHGTIKIGFTPDEEIGRGADHFDVQKFGAEFAYTIDGGPIGELEYENFNAAYARISMHGRNVHPGYAKDKMKNSMLMAIELNEMLPPHQRPEHTDHYDGFYHLISITGTVEETEMQYIVRDHNRAKFENKKKYIQQCVDFMNVKYGTGTVQLKMQDQYYNMREKVEPVMHIVDIAEAAMLEVGVKPLIKPIRGGTDGSRLSYMGLPTPNIFGGGHNFHGKFEFVPVQSMQKAVEVILKIVELYTKKTVK